MSMRITPALLMIILFLVIIWFFRHEYVTRSLKDVSCVERINRYTRDRCLVSHDVPECRELIQAPPCESE